MDALSEILRAARLSGGVFLRGEFTEPWCLDSTLQASDCSMFLGPSDNLILYHYVLEGRLTIRMADGDFGSFNPGQAVILPRNDQHQLSGQQSTRTTVAALDAARLPGPGELMVIEYGGGGPPTRIICGFLGGRCLKGDPLLEALPSFFAYDTSTSLSGQLVRATLEVAVGETSDSRPGSEAMLARISELLFVEAVCHFVDSLPTGEGGWFEALRDRQLSKALALIHRQPAERWTVEQLGRQVGASRSTLAAKFVRILGYAPAEYLVNVRMRLAARDLASGNDKIIEIADRVGYSSESAFSRAFKRYFGVAPSYWREYSDKIDWVERYRSGAEEA